MHEIIAKMVKIKALQSRLKAQYDKLEASILKQFALDTEDTKHKSVAYNAPEGNITVCEADSVKVVYPAMLKEIFGAAYSDMVTEETTYTLTDAAKKMLAAIYKGNYIMLEADQSFDKMINDLPCGEGEKKALHKKIKGRKYDKDKEYLIKIAGFSETEAADYAYLLSEGANWCDFRNMLNINKRTAPEDIQRTIDFINSAVTVETSPKVSLKVVK